MRKVDTREEAGLISTTLRRGMPRHWNGRVCIKELKAADYHWRQMEWIGWYNEVKARQVVQASLGGGAGPRYGNTVFDYRRTYIWDFKVHPDNSPWTILNDREAVDSCIRDHGGVGFVLTVGGAVYNDATGAFKGWHDRLKGKISRYEEQRIARGAPSRRRKVAFEVTEFLAFYFLGSDGIVAGLRDGWLKEFQEGMRNAGGSPRRAKYKINVEASPAVFVVARVRV